MNFDWRLDDMNKVIVDQLSLTQKKCFFASIFFLFYLFIFFFNTKNRHIICISKEHAAVCFVFLWHIIIFNIFFEIPSFLTLSRTHYSLTSFFLASFFFGCQLNLSFHHHLSWQQNLIHLSYLIAIEWWWDNSRMSFSVAIWVSVVTTPTK